MKIFFSVDKAWKNFNCALEYRCCVYKLQCTFYNLNLLDKNNLKYTGNKGIRTTRSVFSFSHEYDTN